MFQFADWLRSLPIKVSCDYLAGTRVYRRDPSIEINHGDPVSFLPVDVMYQDATVLTKMSRSIITITEGILWSARSCAGCFPDPEYSERSEGTLRTSRRCPMVDTEGGVAEVVMRKLVKALIRV